MCGSDTGTLIKQVKYQSEFNRHIHTLYEDIKSFSNELYYFKRDCINSLIQEMHLLAFSLHEGRLAFLHLHAKLHLDCRPAVPC